MPRKTFWNHILISIPETNSCTEQNMQNNLQLKERELADINELLHLAD